MSFFYKSHRIGKNGKPFVMYKIRTLKENVDIGNSFANEEQYTRFGRILRKTKIDELPQLWNILKGDLRLVGPRAEEEKTLEVLPVDIREKLLSVKPGLTSLASIHFFDEGQILEKSADPHYDYWVKVKPTKIVLDFFYIDNRNLLLDAWIVLKTAILIVKSIFR